MKEYKYKNEKVVEVFVGQGVPRRRPEGERSGRDGGVKVLDKEFSDEDWKEREVKKTTRNPTQLFRSQREPKG